MAETRETLTIMCPQCGAPIVVENRYAKIVVCGYCDTHSALETGNATILGKFPKLADLPTYLFLGAEGELAGKPFKAVGRMRYQHKSGYWDEWFLAVEGEDPAWFTEDEGEYALYRPRKFKGELPDLDEVKVGKKYEINGMQVSLLEKGEAVCAGAEGQLNFYFQPGARIRFFDGIADGKLVAIEASDDEIEFFIGDEVTRAEVKVTNRT